MTRHSILFRANLEFAGRFTDFPEDLLIPGEYSKLNRSKLMEVNL